MRQDNEAKEKSSDKPSRANATTLIKPSSGWQILGVKELSDYRDLLYFMVSRNIKVLYAQTILGFAWAILQPLIQIVLFTLVFGRVAKLPTDGIPYVLFSSVAIIPWNYMAQSMTASTQSLIAGKAILGKIYFPRLIFPITAVLSRLIDFAVSLLILLILFCYYRVYPTWHILLLPVFIISMVSVSSGVGFLFSAMAIRFRDVQIAMPFIIRMLMYTAPIIYSATSLPEKYRFIYSLNPVVGIIEGYRSCLLGTPFMWDFIVPGLITGQILFFIGAFYFKRMEKVFVDVI